jgi:hypothetical protein
MNKRCPKNRSQKVEKKTLADRGLEKSLQKRGEKRNFCHKKVQPFHPGDTSMN